MVNDIDYIEDEESEDFEKMLEGSLDRLDSFEPGDKIKGKIVHLSNENVFVDINGKSEAVIDPKELKDENDEFIKNVGDDIDVFVVSTKGGEITLTSKIGKGQTNASLLELAYKNKIPVEGVIQSVIKGGYSISISGIRCFCPLSQIDTKVPQDPESFINKSFSFKIIKFAERGRNIVLSRRNLIEEENRSKLVELKKSLNVGDIITGKLKSIQKFGLFVDIGGTEGLVPKSEISWSRYSELKNYKLDEEITVKVLTIDWDSNKIALSIKSLLPEPWESISNYTEGKIYSGKVVNMINAGAFIEIEPGLEGFIHVSKMSFTKRINKPEDVLTKGDLIDIKVLSIDNEAKRISLELMTDESDPWQSITSEFEKESHNAIVEMVRGNGLIIRLDNGLSGFLPKDEISMAQNSDLQNLFPVGSELKVIIKTIDKSSRNVVFTNKGALKNEELKDYNEFVEKNSSTSGTTLGDQLKNKFDSIKKNIDK